MQSKKDNDEILHSNVITSPIFLTNGDDFTMGRLMCKYTPLNGVEIWHFKMAATYWDPARLKPSRLETQIQSEILNTLNAFFVCNIIQLKHLYVLL